MTQKIAKRKSLRRKYKRYAAAVAGAAILTGAALPGIPAVKALAAEHPGTPSSIRTEQSTSINKDNHRPTRYTAVERSWTENGNNHRNRTTTVREMPNPVDTVKEYASVYGFSPDKDTFTFLDLSSRQATIQVTKSDTGERFRVNLERDRGRFSDWTIVSVYRTAY